MPMINKIDLVSAYTEIIISQGIQTLNKIISSVIGGIKGQVQGARRM